MCEPIQIVCWINAHPAMAQITPTMMKIAKGVSKKKLADGFHGHLYIKRLHWIGDE